MSENVLVAVIAFLAGLITTWGSVYLTHRLQIERDVRLSERDARRRAYAALKGQRPILAQLLVSRVEAYILSDYHENRWRLSGYQKDSIHLQEALRLLDTSEDLVMEVAKAHRDLFETVATVLVSFPASTKLTGLTDSVYHHLMPAAPLGADQIETLAKLQEWRNQAVQSLQDVVHQTVEVPIDALIEYLTECIEADKVSWWQRVRQGIARRSPAQ